MQKIKVEHFLHCSCFACVCCIFGKYSKSVQPSKPGDTPKTGDTSQIGLWIGLAVDSAFGTAGNHMASEKRQKMEIRGLKHGVWLLKKSRTGCTESAASMRRAAGDGRKPGKGREKTNFLLYEVSDFSPFCSLYHGGYALIHSNNRLESRWLLRGQGL